jgi:hypothetical protein
MLVFLVLPAHKTEDVCSVADPLFRFMAWRRHRVSVQASALSEANKTHANKSKRVS